MTTAKKDPRKLSEDDVMLIKRLIEEGQPANLIADFFDIHISTVSNIRLGKTWNQAKEHKFSEV